MHCMIAIYGVNPSQLPLAPISLYTSHIRIWAVTYDFKYQESWRNILEFRATIDDFQRVAVCVCFWYMEEHETHKRFRSAWFSWSLVEARAFWRNMKLQPPLMQYRPWIAGCLIIALCILRSGCDVGWMTRDRTQMTDGQYNWSANCKHICT